MSWRSAVLGLCAMGLVAMVPVEAGAGVCLVKNGSTCLFWSGSVFCDNANATGLGNVNKDPKSLSCEVNAPGAGLLVCGNPGSKKLASPGIQLVYVPLSFSQVVQISQSQVDHNGNASVDITAAATPDQLETLSVLCPNTNWTARDYVPIDMTATVELLDELGDSLGYATFQCTLPNPETLTWDKQTQTIERRQYSCCQEGYDCQQ